ncbi:unnamed protein product [Rhizoctonia solani]|uniref:Laminin domain protein n=1 Tax=Rhizoctonia solani TaxID=456999 RepID=A0A8H3HUE0_9AGAM|nr:unnamed protein product [Rhizoctonia solani]
MAKYRSRYACSIFHTNTTYTPPALPAHVPFNLEPISGIPSDEAVTRVRDAARLYWKFSEIPTMFDPKVDADLSQHLFDLHMEKYLRRCNSTQVGPIPQQPLVTEPSQPVQTAVHDQTSTNASASTNNVGTGADEVQTRRHTRSVDDKGVHDALERSNRLTEQANQLAERSNLLIERSNEISERANQLMERASQSAEPPNAPAEQFNQLVEQLNKHLEESNQLRGQANRVIEELTTPIARFGYVLRGINSVLVGIQHAIVRNHKGNTLDALDCLVNQKGETPGTSSITANMSFQLMSQVYSDKSWNLSVVVDGGAQESCIPNFFLGRFLCFYGIGDGLCLHETSIELKKGLTSALTILGLPMDEVCSPPELPAYLRSVYDLQPVCGVPSDEEVVGIHAVISMASRVIDVPGMGDSRLLAQLSEHLFNVQMVKYRNKYSGAVFPETTTYTPPTLPILVPVRPGPVIGVPSEDQIIKVQDAVRLYQQFSNAPSVYDHRISMELSQHLFDIQMANYMQRAKHNGTSVNPGTSSRGPARTVEEVTDQAEQGRATSNADTGTNPLEIDQPVQQTLDAGVREAIERSNRLAEQANQLIERSNQIAERANALVESNRRVEQPGSPADRSNRLAEQANQLIERSNQIAERANELFESNRRVEQPSLLADRFKELFEHLNLHFKQSNQLRERSNGITEQSIEKLGDTMKNINKILMRIQHAIVRNHKGNTINALDCLVNEKGDTPGFDGHSTPWSWPSKQDFDSLNLILPFVLDA